MELNNRKLIISRPDNIIDTHLQNYPAGAREDVLSSVNMKMYDFMRNCNIEYDKLNAIDYLGKKFTYEEVFIQIEKYAKAFKAYGIQKGDYVSIMLPNIPEIIFVKFALNRIGAVANLIDPRNNPNTVLEYVNNSKSKILITVLDKYQSTIEPIVSKLCVDNIFSISPMQSITFAELNFKEKDFEAIRQGVGCFMYEYRKILLNCREKIKKTGKVNDISELLKWSVKHTGLLDTDYDAFEPATVLYTSGTTGGMKGAVITNEAYNSIYKNLQYGIRNQRPGEKFCGIIPYFTSYGSGAGMFNCMCVRAEQYLYPNFKAKNFVKIVEKDKPNAIIAVPRFYEMLVEAKADIGELELVVIGGDKVLPTKLKEFKKFFGGRDVVIGYGETEFLGVCSVTIDDGYRKTEDGSMLGEKTRPDSSGIPLPGIRVKIINPETMEEVPFMEEGEAFINSVSMMLGYLNKVDETEIITAYDEDGNKYYGTGDKMYLTPDGQLCFVDRYKRLMKRPDGHQVSPNPIETMISKIKGVRSCCVVGLKYKNVSGVIPTAFISLEDNEISKEKIINMIEDASVKELPSFREKALAYVFIGEMPMSNMGKVDTLSLSQQKLEEIIDVYVVDKTFIDNDLSDGKK